MDRRFEDFESGKVKGHTLEEMEAGARELYKNGNGKNNELYTGLITAGRLFKRTGLQS